MRNLVLILFCASLPSSPIIKVPSALNWNVKPSLSYFRIPITSELLLFCAKAEMHETARQAIEQEQRTRGESVITSVDGTYELTKGLFGTAINMVMRVDGKDHKIRMSYKRIDADTLQLDSQSYRRIDPQR